MQTSRVFTIAALCLSVLSTSLSLSLSATPVLADKPVHGAPVSTVLVVKAQGHPMHVDFIARSAKRADLRSNIHRKGLDVAFTEWLRQEQAHVYQKHLNELALQQIQNQTAKR